MLVVGGKEREGARGKINKGGKGNRRECKGRKGEWNGGRRDGCDRGGKERGGEVQS